jgi:hypothetical protein
VDRVDHLRVLLGRPLLEVEEIPDAVEELLAEPAVKLHVFRCHSDLLL